MRFVAQVQNDVDKIDKLLDKLLVDGDEAVMLARCGDTGADVSRQEVVVCSTK